MANKDRNITSEEGKFLKEIGDIIKNKRLQNNLTQYDLAYKAGVSDNVVGQIERAEVSASLIILNRICEVLNIKLVLENKN